jgi:hypothetical protein
MGKRDRLAEVIVLVRYRSRVRMDGVELATLHFVKREEKMSATPEIQGPLTAQERLELANRLYRQYHALCFWHSPRGLVITEELIPFVAKGLRNHGGRRGFILSGKLVPGKTTRANSQRELPECR